MPASSVIYTNDRAIRVGEWIPIGVWGISEVINLCASLGLGITINVKKREMRFTESKEMKFEGGDS